MKVRILSLLLAAMLLLSGCALGGNLDTMLTPPKLSVEQEQIYKALKSVAGSNISLRYPKSGSYLSAFIVDDIDGDEDDEALVFYEKNLLSTDENPLRVCVLDQFDGTWRAVYDRPAAGAEIERVMISRLGENERINIVVGYTMLNQSERTVEIYDYRDSTLACTFSSGYSMFDIADLDRDTQNELLIICGQTTSKSASAAIYRLMTDGNYYASSLTLSESFTDYSQLLYGDAEDGTSCIYLDGMITATTVQTQILTVTDGSLHLAYADAPDSAIRTLRTSGYLTHDIDADGIYEIPITSTFPGYSELPESEQITMTNWYSYRAGGLVRKYSSYYSITDGYAFLLPTNWERRVTVKLDSIADETVFYAYGESVEASTTELLRLCVTTDSDVAAGKLSNGYLLLGARNGAQYLAKYAESGSELCLTAGELVFSFFY